MGGACVGSGFCCKQAPCPFGAQDPQTGWCVHLEPREDDALGVTRYRCGRYDFIQSQPSAWFSPAFGAGCGSTLFNRDRDAVLVALKRKGNDDNGD